jgi:hypothetical protein
MRSTVFGATGRYRGAAETNVPGSMTRPDVARAILDVLQDPATIRHAIGVASPRGWALRTPLGKDVHPEPVILGGERTRRAGRSGEPGAGAVRLRIS